MSFVRIPLGKITNREGHSAHITILLYDMDIVGHFFNIWKQKTLSTPVGMIIIIIYFTDGYIRLIVVDDIFIVTGVCASSSSCI